MSQSGIKLVTGTLAIILLSFFISCTFSQRKSMVYKGNPNIARLANLTYQQVVHKYKTHPKFLLAQKAVWNVAITSKYGVRYVGSAVILRHRRGLRAIAVTAHHVVVGVHKKIPSKLIPLSPFKSNKIIPFKVHSGMPFQDLAILVSAMPMANDGPEAKLSDRLPYLGNSIFMIGAQLGNAGNITNGILNAIKVRTYRHNPKVVCHEYNISSHTWHGNSGGGLFDERGRLIGIVVRLKGYKRRIGYFSLFKSIGGGVAVGLPTLTSMTGWAIYDIEKTESKTKATTKKLRGKQQLKPVDGGLPVQ